MRAELTPEEIPFEDIPDKAPKSQRVEEAEEMIESLTKMNPMESLRIDFFTLKEPLYSPRKRYWHEKFK